MNKKTIIYIACVIALLLVIVFVIYFAISSNKTNIPNRAVIKLERFDEDYNLERTIEIKKKKQIDEIKEICNNLSLEQYEELQNFGISNDVKLDLGDGKFLMIQLDLPEYCYYEDEASGTKLVIKMPEGLLEKVNQILEKN